MLLQHRRSTPLGGSDREGRATQRPDVRGSILILTSVCLSVIVLAVALTVDLGRIATTRRDLQKVADAVALDVVRRLDGSTRDEIRPIAQTAFVNSLERNGQTAEDATFELGGWNPVSETWTPAGPTDVPTAVRVEVRGSIDYAFTPGSTETARRGVAARQASADICAGSFSSRIVTDDSPVLSALLGNILGTSVDLAGYRGIAGGEVSLDLLATNLGLSVGSTSELLNTPITLQEFVLAEADALDQTADLARAALLRQVALALPDPGQILRLGDILALGGGGAAAALTATLDAFDLLSTAALVVTGGNFISIPSLSLGIPGVANVTAEVAVVEPPRCIVGATIGDRVETAVVRLRLNNGLGTLNLVDTSLNAEVQTAAGAAQVSRIDCGSPKRLRLYVTTGLLETKVRFDLGVNLLIGRFDVPVTAATTNAGVHRIYDRLFPASQFGVPYQVPTPGLNLGTVSLTVGPAIPLVSDVVNTLVTTTLRPVLTALDTLVFTPLLRALGTTVGGIDITAKQIRCAPPTLVG